MEGGGTMLPEYRDLAALCMFPSGVEPRPKSDCKRSQGRLCT